MRFSIPFATVYPRKKEKTSIKLLVDAGIYAADFDLECVRDKNHPFASDGWYEAAKEIKDIADSFGLEFNQAHAPFRFKPDEWKNEETFRDFVMPTFVRTLEVCGALGIDVCIIHPLHYLPYEKNAELMFEKNMEYYRALLPVAKKVLS